LLAMPKLSQLIIHAACYGLPLGLLYATAERRVVDVPRHERQRLVPRLRSAPR